MKTTYLVKGIIARLTGDNNDAKAYKIAAKIVASFDLKISLLASEILNASNKVDEAKEKLDTTIFITQFPERSEDYLDGIIEAQEVVDKAMDALQDKKDEKIFFENKLAEFKKEVEKLSNK